MAAVCWSTGLMVRHGGVKVNYTRKLNHFMIMGTPFGLAMFLPYQPNLITMSLRATGFIAATLLLSQPVRRRFSMCQTAFLAIDRPEDRPHTLVWAVSQILVCAVVLAGLFVLMTSLGRPEFLMIPLVVTGIGDGLAEPVGVRFGRHRYRVPSLVRGRVYHRSIEGSLCVGLTAVAVVVALAGTLSGPQLAAMLGLVPIAMTLTEAWSPHTWDAPALYAVGGLLPAAVVTWVP